MDYLFWSVCVFVESRVRGEVDLNELACQTGFSLTHIRNVFHRQTGCRLSANVQQRRLANATQELLHSDESILEIALHYDYSGRDVFSRAFRRHTGYTPTSTYGAGRALRRRVRRRPPSQEPK